jgi:hypothetical protein
MIDLDALAERYLAVWNEPNPTVAMSVSRLFGKSTRTSGDGTPTLRGRRDQQAQDRVNAPGAALVEPLTTGSERVPVETRRRSTHAGSRWSFAFAFSPGGDQLRLTLACEPGRADGDPEVVVGKRPLPVLLVPGQCVARSAFERPKGQPRM